MGQRSPTACWLWDFNKISGLVEDRVPKTRRRNFARGPKYHSENRFYSGNIQALWSRFKARGRPASRRIAPTAATLAPTLLGGGGGGFMAKRTHKGMDAMPPSGAKSRKGHGGARDGAGRRAVLNEDQRSWIGAYYQNSWEKLTRGLARLRQQSDANRYAIRTQGDAGKGALSQLQSTQRSLRKLTVHERRGGWAKNWRSQAEDLIEATGGRYISYAPYIKRPQSFRPALLRTVALTASKRFGVKVSQRMVESSMKQYRAEPEEIRAYLEFCPK